ncbi:peptidase domain-containing ABC transporter [Hanstruepera ponticola]|uniref:peptidase domain-containing ABC transporter n=1 Tax=Hanstruepera ponticola TaxID=2042995 RepID=UPI000CF0A21D|nr:peptidase domain-containing ABC transporter [Hanstruepera ponticola]
MPKFPYFSQTESKDCGPTCLKIIAKHYGKTLSITQIRKISETTREGSNLLNLSDASETLGFRSLGVKMTLKELEKAPLPCILHWNKEHYVVLYKIKKDSYYISDPAFGLISYKKEEFLKFWIGNNATENTQEGIALLLDPTPKFYEDEFEEDKNSKFDFQYILKYLFKYKSFIIQLSIGLLAGSLLQLVVPFLTQSIVDVGIKNQDLNFIYLILFAQIALFLGRTAIEVIRSWILLHISTRINISLVSDFFIKLMKLPISYFDVKMTGDVLQRINDHKRIEKIITTSSLSVLFSMINFIVFSFVLAYYSLQIFSVFVIGSFLYFLWIKIFLKKRATLDYKRFSAISQEQSKVIELINGMQDIKLHNAEKQKRWAWEHTQARLFKVSIKSLGLEQAQSVGSSFINELKNILITVLSAKLVIDGSITLGMMLAISYIVGQLNAPVQQLINFIRELQDAKISLDRLAEIHNMDNEEDEYEKIKEIPTNADITIDNISFRYVGSDTEVLKNLSLHIPNDKTTAVVGTSGSGKTTLMKLLLRFYNPISGEIMLNKNSLKNISQKAWRDNYGVVMQEGYIFNDTIANNIAVGESHIDKKKLANAIDIANIREYIESLPLSYNTKIGMEGIGLSTGQKQRLLIARAVYKNPKFLFFDEATSALDANNEKVIMENLNNFFENKTVVVIAHRLSTVKNAHQIVVLENGEIVEVGNHDALVKKKGNYFNLVKNQLELGK